MDIGSRIRQRRKELKLTQKELARRVGVTDAAVSNWESGKNELSGDSLVLVSAELLVSPVWLQTGKGSKEQSAPRQLSPREAAVLDLYNALLEEQQDDMFRALEAQKHENETLWAKLSKKMGKN
ncbi:MAG: helix-turn-helix domain-containing protein [Thiothrix sp.]|nr:helix-turn-helix domain-containing protein [Thiothrix sp.]